MTPPHWHGLPNEGRPAPRAPAAPPFPSALHQPARPDPPRLPISESRAARAPSPAAATPTGQTRSTGCSPSALRTCTQRPAPTPPALLCSFPFSAALRPESQTPSLPHHPPTASTSSPTRSLGQRSAAPPGTCPHRARCRPPALAWRIVGALANPAPSEPGAAPPEDQIQSSPQPGPGSGLPISPLRSKQRTPDPAERIRCAEPEPCRQTSKIPWEVTWNQPYSTD